METILFEDRCSVRAEYTLNMLLQIRIFTGEQLMAIARKLYEEDIARGPNTRMRMRKNRHMNDTGFFSIQVLTEALKAFDLTVYNIDDPLMKDIKANPMLGRAFLCNFQNHWFALRKFGNQWFELDSMLKTPRLISDYLFGFLVDQLAEQQFSIFVVIGELPDSEADREITLNPIKHVVKKETKASLLSRAVNLVARKMGIKKKQDDYETAMELAMSMETAAVDARKAEEEKNLKAAIEASLADSNQGASTSQQIQPIESDESEIVETPILGKMSSSSDSIPSIDRTSDEDN